MENISNHSSFSPSYRDYINTVNNQLVYYFVIVSSAIGIPGNLISMVVFIRLAIRNPKINMGLLYVCQTAIDLNALIFSLLVFRGSIYLYGYLALNINDSYCRAFAFLRRFTLHASSWMSVLIIFDRFTFVLYENRFKFMKNKLILSAIIFGVMFLIAIADIENLFYYIDSSSKNPSFTCTGSNPVTVASDIISICLRTYIPLILMIVFNLLLINRIFAKKRRASKVVHNSTIKRKEHHFTIAVMSCNVLFFLSKFPLSVFYVFYDLNLYTGNFKKDQTLSDVFNFYMNIFVSISFLDLTLSFFMYLAFNKLFLKEFCRLFFSCLPCCNHFDWESSGVISTPKRNGQASLSLS